jgi:tetratricopeptide (TPR) repeat protein
MSEGLPDRVQQLRQRWMADPASRVFLQLAEEYRHLGRMQDALGVLDAGLKEHPGYLSALVAKGRCHLELGQPEAAREVLERVVRQDATQMVANKLLVRAYLETGQVERARERLELYSLLHDGDPESEELRGRIRRMEAPRMDRSGVGAAPSIAARASGPAPPAATQDDVFDLGLPARPPAPAAGEDDLFDLGLSPVVSQAAALPQEPEPERAVAGEQPAPATGSMPAAGAAPAAPEEPDLEAERADADLFPGLASRTIRRRYHEGLAAEGLFLLDVERAPSSTPAAAATQMTTGAWEPSPRSGPAPASAEPFGLAPEAEPVAAPAWEASWPVPVPAPVLPEPLAGAPPTVQEPWGLAMDAGAVPEPLARAEPEPFDLTPEPGWAPAVPAAQEPTPAEPVAEPLAWEPPSPPAPEPAPEPATVTLGELYLRQGHLEEARRIFDEVLRRDPANRPAREGMARLEERQAGTAEAPEAVAAAPYRAVLRAEPGSPRTRKISLLTDYLERLRRGSRRDVS